MTRCPITHCAGRLLTLPDRDGLGPETTCLSCGRSPTPPPPHVQPIRERRLTSGWVRPQGEMSRAGR